MWLPLWAGKWFQRGTILHRLPGGQCLSTSLPCIWTLRLRPDFSRLKKNADLYFIAIPDDALKTVHQWLDTGDAIAVHTAGSVSSSVLNGISSRYGVVYPLQSLRSDVTAIPDIPLLVDGNTDETLAMISHFARSLSPTVLAADDAYRKKIHLAAVVTGNFSNHLYALAATWCDREGLDFSLLLPLLKETVDRLGKYDVDNLQTGPARRKDEGAIAPNTCICWKTTRTSKNIYFNVRFHKRPLSIIPLYECAAKICPGNNHGL